MSRAVAVAVLVALAAGFGGGWLANGWRLGVAHAEYREAQQQSLAQAEAAMRAAERRYAEEVARIDSRYAEELVHAQGEVDRLRADIAAGAVRLSVPTTRCGGVPSNTATARSVDAATRAELDAATAQRVVTITSDGDAAIRQLTALQDYVRRVCVMQGVGDG